MTSTTLAQRLNDLAAANDQGLLSDDEYRLLRQNLFERYSTAVVPVEAPLVPIAKPSPHKLPPTRKTTFTSSKGTPAPSSLSTNTGTSTSSLPPSSTSNSRSKPTVVTVTNLLRRATGRKFTTSASTSSLSTPLRNSSGQGHPQNALPNRSNLGTRDNPQSDALAPAASYSSSTSTPNVGASSRPGTPSKRSVLPRLLHRKASELGFARSSSPSVKDQPSSRSTVHDPHTTSTHPTPSNNAQRHQQNLPPLSSPTKLPVRRPGLSTNDSFSSVSPTSLSPSSFNVSRAALLSTSPPNSVTLSNPRHLLASNSDLESLTSLTSPISTTSSLVESPETSSAVIHQILTVAEADLGRLLEEFTSLELNILQKLAKARARRLPAPTPKNAYVLMEGKEWRDHSPAQLTLPTVNTSTTNSVTAAERRMSVSSSRQSIFGSKAGQKQKPKPLTSVHLNGGKSTDARTSNGRASTASGHGSVDDIVSSSPSAESSARTSMSMGQAQAHSQQHLLSPIPPPGASPRSPGSPMPSPVSPRLSPGAMSFQSPITPQGSSTPSPSSQGQPPNSATTKSSSSLSTTSQGPSSLSLRRKGSVSSVSSYGASVYGAKLSRSASHLPLSVVAERESVLNGGSAMSSNFCTCLNAYTSTSNPALARLKPSPSNGALPSTCPLHIPEIPPGVVTLFMGLGLNEEESIGVWLDEEVIAVRKRREEVRKRYGERMEYLRAKMKGAELREKLMRK